MTIENAVQNTVQTQSRVSMDDIEINKKSSQKDNDKDDYKDIHKDGDFNVNNNAVTSETKSKRNRTDSVSSSESLPRSSASNLAEQRKEDDVMSEKREQHYEDNSDEECLTGCCSCCFCYSANKGKHDRRTL